MSTVSDLRQAAQWVTEAAQRSLTRELLLPYRALRSAGRDVGRAWCGSWRPGFADLYDSDLTPLPPDLRLHPGCSQDRLSPALRIRCRRWTLAQIRAAIQARAVPFRDHALRERAVAANTVFNDAAVAALALLECAARERTGDPQLMSHVGAARLILVADPATIIERWRPRGAAFDGGDALTVVPPHLAELAALESLMSPFEALRQIAALLRSAAAQLEERSLRTWPMLSGHAGLPVAAETADLGLQARPGIQCVAAATRGIANSLPTRARANR